MGYGGIRTLEQRITAGSNFNGTEPDGPVVRAAGVEQFPPGNHGGLFLFGIQDPHYVRTIELILGGQSGWTVHKRDIDARELLVLRGDDEGHVVLTERDSFVINVGQALVVRTTGATATLLARVSIQSLTG